MSLNYQEKSQFLSQDKSQFLSRGRSRLTIKGLFHTLLIVLTWILFAYWWIKVIPQISVEDASMAFLVIFLTFLICSVLTLLWVRYNILSLIHI